MRKERSAHRLRLTLTLTALTLVAFGSFWLLQLLNRSGDELQADKRLNEPDYIIEQFSVVRMTGEGKPSYIVSGDKLTHRPIDDASDIDKPVVRNLGGEHPPMDIKSDRARIDENNTRVQLLGNVRIHRAAAAKSAAMDMRTDALTLYPDEDRMTTDRPVRLVSGNATADGVGLRANNATRQLSLGGRGTIVYPPPQQPRQ